MRGRPAYGSGGMEWPAIARVVTAAPTAPACLQASRTGRGTIGDDSKDPPARSAPVTGTPSVRRRSVRLIRHRVWVQPAHCIGVSGETASV